MKKKAAAHDKSYFETIFKNKKQNPFDQNLTLKNQNSR